MKNMSEERYRICKLIVMVVFVIGALVIGSKIANNGRYVQYDYRKNTVVIGSTSTTYQTRIIDSRTGSFR